MSASPAFARTSFDVSAGTGVSSLQGLGLSIPALVGALGSPGPAHLADLGRRWLAAVVGDVFDEAQRDSVYEQSLVESALSDAHEIERERHPVEVDAAVWAEHWENLAARVKNAGSRDRSLARDLASTAATPVPAQHVARAALSLPEHTLAATQAYASQVRGAGSMNAVDRATGQQMFEALRTQYLDLFAAPKAPGTPGTPEATPRPVPPSTWVRGFTERDWVSRRCPADPASLYAFYRLGADAGLFTDAQRGVGGDSVRYVSTDLETAAPGDTWDPADGYIIETAVVTFDGDGAEVDCFSALTRPPAEALAAYGTGAVHVHGIEVADLDGAPAFDEVTPRLGALLDGGFMVAQSDHFERGWLAHHMEGFDAEMEGTDTFRIAKQHIEGLESYRLGLLCEHTGVPYTSGHRAEHDARSAGLLFFTLRDRVRAGYAANSTFAGLAVPTVPGVSAGPVARRAAS